MLRSHIRRLRGDHGAQAVEFAILVPILLLILGGIVGFGFVFNAQITLTQAAREGARLAAICGQDAGCLGGVDTKVQENAGGLTLSAGQISVTSCPAGVADASATVEITYDESIGFPPIGGVITLHGRSSTPCGG